MKRISIAVSVAAAVLFTFPSVFAVEYDYIGTVRAPGATTWGGLKWTTTERNRFKGRPVMNVDSDTTNYLTIAYARFTSFYDLRNYTPRWVAYVTDRSSATVIA